MLPAWAVMLLIFSPLLAIAAAFLLLCIYIDYKNKHIAADASKLSKFEKTACITKDEHTTWLGSNPRRK